MLNILWIEDNYDDQKEKNWFQNRKPISKNNFSDSLEEIENNINKYDLVILDINLENSGINPTVTRYAKEFGYTDEEAFLRECGVFLFLKLIEKGFERDRVIFLTGNADEDENISLVNALHKAAKENNDDNYNDVYAKIQNKLDNDTRNKLDKFTEDDDNDGLCDYLESYFNNLNKNEKKNTYNKFRNSFKQAFILPPKAISKGSNVATELNDWLKDHENNSYLVLRRGIIEGCQHSKTLTENQLRFNDFIKEKEKNISFDEIKDYLEVLENFLPLQQPLGPKKKEQFYKLFIRTLAHEWEAVNKIRIDKQNKTELAWIMKSTRRWITHNSNLFNELDEQTVAYLFIINMRIMFDFYDDNLQNYEEILLKLFQKNNTHASNNFNSILTSGNYLNLVSDAYLDLRKKIIKDNEDNQKNKNDIFIDDNTLHFTELANNIQLSRSKLRDDKMLFIKILYQIFWLITSNPCFDKRSTGKFLEIKFWQFKYHNKPYLFELAKHIYDRSFS